MLHLLASILFDLQQVDLQTFLHLTRLLLRRRLLGAQTRNLHTQARAGR